MLDWVGPLLMCPEEVGRVPGGVPGVYLLHSFSEEWGGYPVFYVGQTADIRRRLHEHMRIRSAKLSISAMQRVARPYFSAAPVGRFETRLAVEAGLVAMLTPPCNSQQPSGSILIPNLPPISLSLPDSSF